MAPSGHLGAKEHAIERPAAPATIPLWSLTRFVGAGLGRGLRRCRERAAVRQEVLADQAGLYRNYVGLLERGERNASAKLLIALAHALTICSGDLF
ncbi:MAG: helix-turn-helix transcriptional regulator [Caulobacter sp.]|nr:helix-turn-helix transcriptional regulator [Caulobacter sp.]